MQKQYFIKKIINSFVVCTLFLGNIFLSAPAVWAQRLPSHGMNLPALGTMVNLSLTFDPAVIKGMKVDPSNPFEFEFIVDVGESGLEGKALKEESKKLIKYFLASLTIPEDDLWVNLSPYEKERIIPEALGQTGMGRDLLVQDYLLKQITASLMHPEGEVGKKLWTKIYKKAYQQYGLTDIPVNTFNKVWIMPDKASVYENEDRMFVVDQSLKVMLEKDYLAHRQTDLDLKSKNQNSDEDPSLSADMIRKIIIPVITKEVNEGAHFANLRQIYYSMILATWFKQNLKKSLLGQGYVDQEKVKGVNITDKEAKEKIYQRYLQAYKKGVYDYIKEEYDPNANAIVPRKYFSGGIVGENIPVDTAILSDKLRKEWENPQGLVNVVSSIKTVNASPNGSSDLKNLIRLENKDQPATDEAMVIEGEEEILQWLEDQDYFDDNRLRGIGYGYQRVNALYAQGQIKQGALLMTQGEGFGMIMLLTDVFNEMPDDSAESLVLELVYEGMMIKANLSLFEGEFEDMLRQLQGVQEVEDRIQQYISDDALREMGLAYAQELKRFVVNYIADKTRLLNTRDVRFNAVQALGLTFSFLGEDDSSKITIQKTIAQVALKDTDWQVRKASLNSIDNVYVAVIHEESIVDPAKTQKRIVNFVLRGFLQSLLEDKHNEVRKFAAQKLAEVVKRERADNVLKIIGGVVDILDPENKYSYKKRTYLIEGLEIILEENFQGKEHIFKVLEGYANGRIFAKGTNFATRHAARKVLAMAEEAKSLVETFDTYLRNIKDIESQIESENIINEEGMAKALGLDQGEEWERYPEFRRLRLRLRQKQRNPEESQEEERNIGIGSTHPGIKSTMATFPSTYSPEQVRAILRDKYGFKHIIGFSTSLDIYQEDIPKMIKTIQEYMKQKGYSPQETLVVSGATFFSGHQIIYGNADQSHFQTMGVINKKNANEPFYPIDYVYVQGDQYGEEFKSFAALIDELVLISGGPQALQDSKEVLSLGKNVYLVQRIRAVDGRGNILLAAAADKLELMELGAIPLNFDTALLSSAPVGVDSHADQLIDDKAMLGGDTFDEDSRKSNERIKKERANKRFIIGKIKKKSIILVGHLHSENIIIDVTNEILTEGYGDPSSSFEERVEAVLTLTKEIRASLHEDADRILEVLSSKSIKTIGVEAFPQQAEDILEDIEEYGFYENARDRFEMEGLDKEDADEIFLHTYGPVFYLFAKGLIPEHVQIKGFENFEMSKSQFQQREYRSQTFEELLFLMHDLTAQDSEFLQKALNNIFRKMDMEETIPSEQDIEETIALFTKRGIPGEIIQRAIQQQEAFNKIASQRNGPFTDSILSEEGNILLLIGVKHLSREIHGGSILTLLDEKTNGEFEILSDVTNNEKRGIDLHAEQLEDKAMLGDDTFDEDSRQYNAKIKKSRKNKRFITGTIEKRSITLLGQIHPQKTIIEYINRLLGGSSTSPDFLERNVQKALTLTRELRKLLHEDVDYILDVLNSKSIETIGVEAIPQDVEEVKYMIEVNNIYKNYKKMFKLNGLNEDDADEIFLHTYGPVFYLFAKGLIPEHIQIKGVENAQMKEISSKKHKDLNAALGEFLSFINTQNDQNFDSLRELLNDFLEDMGTKKTIPSEEDIEAFVTFLNEDGIPKSIIRRIIQAKKEFNKISSQRNGPIVDNILSLTGNVLLVIGFKHLDQENDENSILALLDKKTDGEFEILSDVTNNEKGGIDLHAEHLNLKTQGQGVNFDLPIDEALLSKVINAEGLTPVITTILPITNLLFEFGLTPLK